MLPTTFTVMFFQRFYIFLYVFICTFYFSIAFTETLFFRHFLKRHLLTLLTLIVAKHSSGSKTLTSLRYTRSELLSLRSHRPRNRDVISAINRFGICAHRFRRRTQRGGRRKQHAIKVIDTGLRTSTCSYTRMDRRNLINVHSISNNTKTLSGLCVGCFNEQSVPRNCDKRTEISTSICDQHMDILFITETWLRPHGDEGRLHDLNPAGYIDKSFPRESRGGHIAVIYNKRLFKQMSMTATFSFHHQSFEVIRLSITLTSGNINFFCLYRTPPDRNNQLTDSSFFSEFSFCWIYVIHYLAVV